METLYMCIAVLAYAISAVRILCFDGKLATHSRIHEFIAFVLVSALVVQSLNILFFKRPVILFDAVFAILMLIIILRSKGNIALMFRSKAL
ncbi:phage holin family protein [Acinetobacter seifertii]|nr:phage holin family protein [Acinetobacter seifertii]